MARPLPAASAEQGPCHQPGGGAVGFNDLLGGPGIGFGRRFWLVFLADDACVIFHVRCYDAPAGSESQSLRYRMPFRRATLF